ncbi:MAG: AMP-binding protein, partial [Christiangramia sp.]|nr:AMP-binding protein [Christiangramia sp.]
MSNYHIKNLEEYFQVYRKSVREPENFWQEVAEEHFVWRKKWDNVLRWDFSKPEVKWFENAKLNITENCIDRHLLTNGDKTAIIWEPNEPGDKALHLTYNELHKKVNKFANVLKDNGIQKGDRVCIYLPMIPELAYAVLACARIGAIHSVVFAGFSSSALATRTLDADCKMLITSDGSFRGAKTLDLKGIVDRALEECPDVKTVLVAKRTGAEINMKEGRDKWLEPLMEEASDECSPEIMDSEDPLFILYTSGTTGKPKGTIQTHGGFSIFAAHQSSYLIDLKPSDILFWYADMGWITGQTWIVYGSPIIGSTA